MRQLEAIFIAGPTASGKSALAVKIAQQRDSVIINADSMQVYNDLSVLTARPTRLEMAGIPHELFGHIDGAVNFNVGSYLKSVQNIRENEKRLLIFVGGTGLYFKTMLEGLSDMPAVSDEIRANMRSISEADLHDVLGKVDQESALKLNPNDSVRILRALEIFHQTGVTIGEWRRKNPPQPMIKNAMKVFINPPREKLYEAINARYIKMMGAGALDEVRALMHRQLDPMLPVMRAHGVPSLIKYLQGEMSMDEAIEIGQTDTRHYAKRQWTWFRNQMQDWLIFTPELAYDEVIGKMEC